MKKGADLAFLGNVYKIVVQIQKKNIQLDVSVAVNTHFHEGGLLCMVDATPKRGTGLWPQLFCCLISVTILLP